MTLKIGETYTFRYKSGIEAQGKVLDVIEHPDIDPVYKVNINGGIRLIRASRLVEVPKIEFDEPTEVDVPTKPPATNSRWGAVLTWWKSFVKHFRFGPLGERK